MRVFDAAFFVAVAVDVVDLERTWIRKPAACALVTIIIQDLLPVLSCILIPDARIPFAKKLLCNKDGIRMRLFIATNGCFTCRIV